MQFGQLSPQSSKTQLRPTTMRRFLVAWLVAFVALVVPPLHGTWLVAAENEAVVEQRILDSVKYLASDDLEGRGVGTAGLDKAAQYIADEFSEMGLKTDWFDGTPFQKFTITASTEMGPQEKNRLVLVGPAANGGDQPQRIELELGKDFNPLAVGGTGKIDAPIVFVGYGITAKDKNYDDYEGIDVKGKVVLILRKEPQQANPHSAFDGTQTTQHATFQRKIANAYEHGAAAVLLVNDDYGVREQQKAAEKAWQDAVDKLADARDEFRKNENPTPEDVAKYRKDVSHLAQQIQEMSKRLEGDFDEVLGFQEAGPGGNRRMPVFFCRREVFATVVSAAFGDKDLTAFEREIDKELKPQSAAAMGWRVEGQANVVRKDAEVKNVIGVLEGEGPLADETVVIGAHYDHLGLGGPGSLAPWTKEIHNGADDNASGAAALIEVARRFATRDKKPRRRLVFMAFTAEERGLLGSAHYVKQPLFPLENTVAMVNMDMVGRMDENKLIVFGTGTAAEFDALIDNINKSYEFKIRKDDGGFGPSDHSSFYAKKIPVFHVFTGTHSDYHRPSDDYDKINIPGMRRVTDFVTDIVDQIDAGETRPEYREVKGRSQVARSGDRPYLGTIPDFAQEVEGYALMGVSKGGPAERAGLQSGDVIIKFGESKIGGLEDIDSALRKYKAGDEVEVAFKRSGETMTTKVRLDPPR